ncbi:MAG: hypothetical protein MJZ12_05440 [Prevotella sp.]|nr:hypothetical protein [Prevotella sp.]
MLFIAAAGCSSDVAEVYPDGSDEIRISMGRSFSLLADPESGYRSWNRTIDPTTMGVIATTNSESIFNNASFSAPAQESETEWIANDGKKKYWLDYSSATSLDFFAYMPHIAGATLDGTGSSRTLTLPGVPGILGTSEKPYLVIASPLHFSSAYGNTSSLALKMDQLMTCLCFQFMLGADMSTLRTFKITKVKVSEIPASATVKQTYTFDGSWTKGSMTLKSVSADKTYTEITNTDGIRIGYNNNPSKFTVYPGNFYMLPFDFSQVTPQIDVTYDVYDEDGYKTRSAVSTILLNKTNFPTLSQMQSAHRIPIKIKIVPDNLYILSDADQSIAGYLVVGQ